MYAPSLQQVLVFRGGDGKHYHNDLFAFDVKSRDWVPLEPTGPRPAARASHGAVMWRDDMFIFGGWNGHARMNDLWRLDTRTMCWAEVRAGGPLPSPRTGMGMVATRGLLLAVGGGGEDGVPLGGLLAFDPREERWLEVSCEHRAAARQSPDDDAPSNAGRAPLLVLQRAGGGRPMLALPLMGHAVCVAGTRCFVVGGGNARQPSGPSVAIETDVPPAVRVTARPPTVSLAGGVAELLGSEAFADVVLVAEGCRVPAHRLVLVCTNERFRGMFTSGACVLCECYSRERGGARALTLLRVRQASERPRPARWRCQGSRMRHCERCWRICTRCAARLAWLLRCGRLTHARTHRAGRRSWTCAVSAACARRWTCYTPPTPSWRTG